MHMQTVDIYTVIYIIMVAIDSQKFVLCVLCVLCIGIFIYTYVLYVDSKLLDINRGDLRLFNGNRTSGTLEIQLDGAWQQLCYSSAIHLAPITSVACRELGYFGVNQIIA